MDTAPSQRTERVHAASADQTPLRIRGGGSKDLAAWWRRGDGAAWHNCTFVVLDADWRGAVGGVSSTKSVARADDKQAFKTLRAWAIEGC